jgi:6-phosphogluconolactonase
VAQFVPVIGRNRMTFTYPLLNAARHVMFLVTGADKAGALADLFSDDPAVNARIPAASVMPSGGELTFMLDAASASQLTQQVH